MNMSEVELAEKFDQAVEALLREPDAASTADSQLAGLLEIGAALRALPRPDFKARLGSEFKTVANEMDEQEEPQSQIREGFRTITPYLTVPDVFAEIEFLTKAFGAEGQVYGIGSAGGYHSEYRIGESMVMIGGGGGRGGVTPPRRPRSFFFLGAQGGRGVRALDRRRRVFNNAAHRHGIWRAWGRDRGRGRQSLVPGDRVRRRLYSGGCAEPDAVFQSARRAEDDRVPQAGVCR